MWRLYHGLQFSHLFPLRTARKENTYLISTANPDRSAWSEHLPQRFSGEACHPISSVPLGCSNVQPTAAPGQKVVENSRGTPTSQHVSSQSMTLRLGVLWLKRKFENVYLAQKKNHFIVKALFKSQVGKEGEESTSFTGRLAASQHLASQQFL